MTVEQTTGPGTPAPAPATPAPPPSIEDVAKFSASQADTWLKDLQQRVDWVGKLLKGGDPGTLALFNKLCEKRSEADAVDEVLAADDMPLPVDGGANDHGLSKRDVRSGIAGLLDDGLSTGAVAELLRNQPVVSPADYRVIARDFSERCLKNPLWQAALLAGDPVAKRQLLAWGTVKLTSRPIPESPRFDVVK